MSYIITAEVDTTDEINTGADKTKVDASFSKKPKLTLTQSLLIGLLAQYIGKAFDNEKDFLTKFWPGHSSDELIECYMASESTRIAILVDSGATVTYTIITSEFIDWCNER